MNNNKYNKKTLIWVIVVVVVLVFAINQYKSVKCLELSKIPRQRLTYLGWGIDQEFYNDCMKFWK